MRRTVGATYNGLVGVVDESEQGMRGRVLSVVGACALVAVTCAPVAAQAARSGPTPSPGSPGSPQQHPTPKPPKPPTPKPPPPGHVPRTWPVVTGDRGPLVDSVQQRLVWLGYPVKPTHVMDRATLAAVATFRAKWGLGSTADVSASVWAKLASVTRSHGVLPSSCTRSSLVLCVDKTARVLRVVRNGKVVLTVDARFGGPGFETRNGTFRVYRKSRDHVSTEYHTPMPYAMFFSGGQAVHYSPFFHRDGYNGHSHGCVNLRDKSIAALLFGQVPVGTRVVVYP
jgi:hypothetical protein